MYTSKVVTVPANTSKADPVRVQMPLSRSIIVYFAFYMYPESVGYTHFTIEHLTRQLFPFDVEEDYSIPGHLVEYHPDVELQRLPYDLDIVAWNLDNRFPHDIHIFVGTKRKTLLGILEQVFAGA